jgi:hypothetical protein
MLPEVRYISWVLFTIFLCCRFILDRIFPACSSTGTGRPSFPMPSKRQCFDLYCGFVDPDSLNLETDTDPEPAFQEIQMRILISLHPTIENIRHFKSLNLLTAFYFSVSFIRIRIAYPDLGTQLNLDPTRMRIRIHNTGFNQCFVFESTIHDFPLLDQLGKKSTTLKKINKTNLICRQFKHGFVLSS